MKRLTALVFALVICLGTVFALADTPMLITSKAPTTNVFKDVK